MCKTPSIRIITDFSSETIESKSSRVTYSNAERKKNCQPQIIPSKTPSRVKEKLRHSQIHKPRELTTSRPVKPTRNTKGVLRFNERIDDMNSNTCEEIKSIGNDNCRDKYKRQYKYILCYNFSSPSSFKKQQCKARTGHNSEDPRRK